MILPAGNGRYVEISQTKGAGSAWTVRLFKKMLFFKKRESSDWFLEEEQARKFGEQLAKELKNGGSLKSYLERHPGWTLHQPPH